MTLSEHIANMRAAQPHPVKDLRYLVTLNTASAYAGKWGIYDTERGLWINFRETELAAYRLLSALLQEGTLA